MPNIAFVNSYLFLKHRSTPLKLDDPFCLSELGLSFYSKLCSFHYPVLVTGYRRLVQLAKRVQ